MFRSFNSLWALLLLLITSCTVEEFQIQSDPDEVLTLRSGNVPLKGELNFTTVSTNLNSEIAVNIYEGGGNLTHLGKVTCVVTQNVLPSGIFYGSIIITSANGDRLDMRQDAGSLTSLDPETLDFTSEVDFEITGGSGRFSDATGSGKGFGSGTFPRFPPMGAPVTVTVEFDGQISY